MPRLQPVKIASVSVASLGDNTVVAAVTGAKIRVLHAHISASAANNVKFKSGAATDISKLFYMAAAGASATLQPTNDVEDYWFETAAGQALVLNLSVAAAVDVLVAYVEL